MPGRQSKYEGKAQLILWCGKLKKNIAMETDIFRVIGSEYSSV